MTTNRPSQTETLDTFLKLLVSRRRLERIFDLAAGICTLADLDDGREYRIDISSLKCCCSSKISGNPSTAV